MVGPRTPVAGPVIMCTGYNALRVRTCDVPDVPDVRRAGRAERAERAERADWVEGIRTALRRATSMTARYGEPLPLDVRDVFIEQAPEGVRLQVADKLARVRF